MKPIKILYVHGGILNHAGTELFMLNAIKTMDHEMVQVDFLVFGCDIGSMETEFLENGSKLYRFPYRIKDFLAGGSMRQVVREIRLEGYDIVHSHANAFDGIILGVMKHLGIPVRISHSHNSNHGVENPFARFFLNRMKRKIPYLATQCFACSHKAGDFLFENHEYRVINNGIDTDLYAYNPSIRDNVRHQMGLEDKIVIGHIGRFSFEKHHSFLIEVFKAYKKIEPKAHLVLVGEGYLKEQIQKQVDKYGLHSDVTFMGVLPNTNDLYQAFDIFILPSLFEGFPYVLVEAQCSGLPCIVSNAVSSEAQLTDCVEFLDCERTGPWVEALKRVSDINRHSNATTLTDLGYNKNFQGTILTQYYLELLRKH